MKLGKIPTETLKNIIINTVNNGIKKNEVIIKPSIGEDCTAVDLKNEFCVLSTDPITGASENIGKLAVNINVNDIASSGAVPIGIMTTILLPPQSTEKDLKIIMDDLYNSAKEAEIEIIGGHTEITDAVTRPVISCTVIGKTVNKKFITSSGAEIGQDVIMTKWAGVEGTAIIATEFEEELKDNISQITINNAKKLYKNISIVKEAMISYDFGATCMHDVTEGGIYGACWEIADCSSVGIEIYNENIPILNETKIICDYFNINPYKLISSGSLLITCYNGKKLIKTLEENNIKAEIIGKIVNKNRTVVFEDKKIILEEPKSDELYKIKLK